jgi:hypothetical protein
MSALRREADILAGLQHVRFVPTSGLMHRNKRRALVVMIDSVNSSARAGKRQL